jgi:hypothetical protein
MMRYGFVPYGRRNHGNLCGPCDTAELTFLRAAGAAFPQPALLLDKSPPYIRIRRHGIRPGFCSRSQPLATIPEVGFRNRFGRLAPTVNRRGSLHELAISREAT